MYFRQFWQDPELAFDRKPGSDKIVLSGSSVDDRKFWIPDTFIVNTKEGFLFDLTMKNVFLRILHTGDVLLSQRLQFSSNDVFL